MFTWNSSPFKDAVERAVVRGMNHVMADCVLDAQTTLKDHHHVVTGTLVGSIRFEQPQKISGDIVGEWGSFDVNYAIFLEMGTIDITADPYLRPAAQRHYPKLQGYIAQGMPV